jgi:Flp pilus assembly pilin Flp
VLSRLVQDHRRFAAATASGSAASPEAAISNPAPKKCHSGSPTALNEPLTRTRLCWAVNQCKGEAMRSILQLLSDNRGATEIEYGLFAALIAVGAVGVLQLFGVIQPH